MVLYIGALTNLDNKYLKINNLQKLPNDEFGSFFYCYIPNLYRKSYLFYLHRNIYYIGKVIKYFMNSVVKIILFLNKNSYYIEKVIKKLVF